MLAVVKWTWPTFLTEADNAVGLGSGGEDKLVLLLYASGSLTLESTFSQDEKNVPPACSNDPEDGEDNRSFD